MNDLQSQLEKWQTHQNSLKHKNSLLEKRAEYWDDKPIDFETSSKIDFWNRDYHTRKKVMKAFLEGAAYAKQLKKFKKRENF
jgi:hypothetical protein